MRNDGGRGRGESFSCHFSCASKAIGLSFAMTSEGGVKQVSCRDRQCVKAIDEFHNVMHSSIRFVFCDPVSTQGVTSVKHPQMSIPVARGRRHERKSIIPKM